MTSREFAEWQAFFDLHPFGPLWADIRAASLQALIAEINRDRKKRRQPFGLDDFMPAGWLGAAEAGPEQLPTQAELLAKIKAWAAGFKRDQHGNTE